MALSKPQPITRRRFYDIVAALSALGIALGVVTAEDINSVTEGVQAFSPVVPLLVSLLARFNVDIPGVDEESFIEGFPEENTEE